MLVDAEPLPVNTAKFLSVLSSANFKIAVAGITRQCSGYACAGCFGNVDENELTTKVYNAHLLGS